MPVPLAPIIIPAVATALGSVFGAKTQKSAMRDASRMEAQATDKALAYQREQDAYTRRMAEEDRAFDRGRYAEERDYGRGQYANYLGRLQPYGNAGAGAVTNLASYASRAMPGTIPTMGDGQMVKIQAPDGSVRDVPAQHAQHYIGLGGKVVGG